jgi:nucleoside-diphosphate-sugar epimerase
MASWKVLVTGSSGLIGSEAARYFDRQGHQVVGVDNNVRCALSVCALVHHVCLMSIHTARSASR